MIILENKRLENGAIATSARCFIYIFTGQFSAENAWNVELSLENKAEKNSASVELIKGFLRDHSRLGPILLDSKAKNVLI